MICMCVDQTGLDYRSTQSTHTTGAQNLPADTDSLYNKELSTHM